MLQILVNRVVSKQGVESRILRGVPRNLAPRSTGEEIMLNNVVARVVEASISVQPDFDAEGPMIEMFDGACCSAASSKINRCNIRRTQRLIHPRASLVRRPPGYPSSWSDRTSHIAHSSTEAQLLEPSSSFSSSFSSVVPVH